MFKQADCFQFLSSFPLFSIFGLLSSFRTIFYFFQHTLDFGPRQVKWLQLKIYSLLVGAIVIGISDLFCRANAQQPKLFVGMILILIFAEALALYGLIVGIILSSRAGQSRAE